MTTNRDRIVNDVRNFKPARGMNNVPGMPLTHFVMDEMPTVRELLADGTLKLVDVVKPSKVDPTQTMTYTYVTVA